MIAHLALALATLAAPCEQDSTYHLLDFWVGSWIVTSNGKRDGTDRVTKILQGCAVEEQWIDTDGHAGRGIFYVAPGGHRWRQVWVTDAAPMVGGTKEKAMVAHVTGQSTRFQGELSLGDGRVVLDRTTLTRQADGHVHQVIEISRDGGTTWQVGFDADYAPSP
jgi:hypothetical protein